MNPVYDPFICISLHNTSLEFTFTCAYYWSLPLIPVHSTCFLHCTNFSILIECATALEVRSALHRHFTVQLINRIQNEKSKSGFHANPKCIFKMEHIFHFWNFHYPYAKYKFYGKMSKQFSWFFRVFVLSVQNSPMATKLPHSFQTWKNSVDFTPIERISSFFGFFAFKEL